MVAVRCARALLDFFIVFAFLDLATNPRHRALLLTLGVGEDKLIVVNRGRLGGLRLGTRRGRERWVSRR